jgi:hypothetical protein
MKIAWVVADRTDLDPAVDIDRLKAIGSIWGGWRTWRGCQTDNVICHNGAQAQQLVAKNFYMQCNFYVPNSLHVILDLPANVHAYEGNLAHDIEHPDELVAMHLAAATNDIVLLLGFDWTNINSDQREIDYRGLVAATMASNSETQWVLLDQSGPVRAELVKLPNFTQDTLPNVLKMFAT